MSQHVPVQRTFTVKRHDTHVAAEGTFAGVSRHVGVQHRRTRKRLAALAAAIRPLSGVLPRMSPQIHRPQKLLLANITPKLPVTLAAVRTWLRLSAAVWLLTSAVRTLTFNYMNSSVIPKRARISEFPVADAAAKRLFARVDTRVHLQRRRPREHLAADAAAELRLADVSLQVVLQVARLRKLPLAHEADVRLYPHVCTHMQPEVVGLLKFPSTHGTRKWTLSGVNTPMSVERTRVEKLAIAHVTHILRRAAVCPQVSFHAAGLYTSVANRAGTEVFIVVSWYSAERRTHVVVTVNVCS